MANEPSKTEVEVSIEASADVTVAGTVRVLLVDDDAGFSKVASQLLEMQGSFRVEAVGNVWEALEKLEKGSYDVVVSDYQMPGKNGLEFLEELRQKGNGIPFVLFTGKGREEVASKALNLGADRYIDKHGDPETVYYELAHAIRQAADRKSALIESLKREAKLEAILESSPEAITVIDLNGKIVECNQKALDMLGYSSKDELIGRNGFALIAEKDRGRAKGNLAKVVDHGPMKNMEYIALTKDGTEFSAELSASVVKDFSGNPMGFAAITRDITERKKAERESGIKDAALASSIDAVAFADLKGNLTYVNNSFLRIWGYANDKEVLGRPATDFWLSEEKAVELVKALNDEEGWIGELTAKKKDGSTFEAQLSASLVKDETGKPLCMMGSFLDVTEHRKAGQSLKESEEKHRRLVELAPDGIVAVNAEGIVTSANRSFLTLVGYDSEEGIVGKPFTELMTMRMEDIPRFQGMFMSLMKGESPSPSEFLYVRRDGTSRWAEVHPGLLIKDGNPVGVQAIMRDVTDRKNAEEALRETKDYLDNLLNYANAPIIVWDNEHEITLFNNAFEALTGYKKKSMLGRNIDVLFPPLQKTEILQTIERATRGEKWQSVEVPILCKDKETRIALWNSANVTDKDGNIVATIAQGQDITERKALEGALRDAKQKWTSLTENTDDIVMIVDSEGIIQYINRTIPPYTPEGTIGKTVYEYVPREQHDTLRSSLEKAFEMGVPLSYVVSSNIPKIGTVWFETKIVPVKDDEKTVSAILMSIDITELKNTEERLKETNMKLVVTNEKLRVVGGLTRHDVRNKLSAMTGNAYLLRQKLVGDAKALEQLKDMEAAVRLVERIFEFARNYENLGVEQPTSMDVGQTVDRAVSLFSDLKGVEIVNECGGLTVLADSLLKQLVYNLIDNSLKYGEKIRQIKIHYNTLNANQLELVYEDDGVGIPDNMRSNLFKEGFTSGKGTGYGLFMIKRICEVYGWTIQETGTPGKGAQFTITIPKTKPKGMESYRQSGLARTK